MQKNAHRRGLFVRLFFVLCTSMLSLGIIAEGHTQTPDKAPQVISGPIPTELLEKYYYFETRTTAPALSPLQIQERIVSAAVFGDFYTYYQAESFLRQHPHSPPCSFIRQDRSPPDKEGLYSYVFGCLVDPDSYEKFLVSFFKLSPKLSSKETYSSARKLQRDQWYAGLPQEFRNYLYNALSDVYTSWQPVLATPATPKQTLLQERLFEQLFDIFLFKEQHTHALWEKFQRAQSSSGGSASAGSLHFHPSNDNERATFDLDSLATDPAYPSTLTGPDKQAAGATNTYVMTLNGVTDPIKAAYQDVYYHFALYNITALVQKGLKEQAQQQALAGGAPVGSQPASLLDKRYRDLDRRLDDVKTDTKTAFRGIVNPKPGTWWEQSKGVALDVGSLAGTNASAIVALGGFAVGSFVDWVSEGEQEIEVIAPKEPGIYLLRGIGTPRPWHGVRRASSVAVKIIEVQSPESMAKDARDAGALALDELTLKLTLAMDPAERDKWAQAYKALHAQLEELPKVVLGQQDSELHEAQKTAKPEEQAALKASLDNVHKRARLAEAHNEKFLDPSKTIRPQAAFVSSENSMTIPLLLTMGRLKDDAGLVRFGLSDITVPDGSFYDAAGTTEEEALWNVVEKFAGQSGYGRGALAITIPQNDKLASLLISSRVISCHPTGPSLLKNRLGDLAIVLTLVSLPVSSVGLAATLVGGSVSVVRLYERFERGTLTWDTETATDLLMLLGAAGSGVGSLGKFVRVKVGDHFALVNKFATLREIKDIADALNQIEKGGEALAHVAGIGGLVVGNVSLLVDLNQIDKKELAGTMTHIEARRARINLLVGDLQNKVLFIRGLRSLPSSSKAAELQASEPILREPLLLREGSLKTLAVLPERRSLNPEATQRMGPSTAPPDPRLPPRTPLDRPLSPAELRRFDQQTSSQTPGAGPPVDAQAQLPVPQRQAATGTDGKPALSKPGSASGTAKQVGQQGGATGTEMSTGGSDSGNSGGSSTLPPGTVSPSSAKELPGGSQGPASTPEATKGLGSSSGPTTIKTVPFPEFLLEVQNEVIKISQKLRGIGRSDLTDVIYEVGALEGQSPSKVTGIKPWVEHVATQSEKQVLEYTSEILEARRLAQETALDPSLQIHVTNRGEFDIHIERVHPDRTITTVRQVEVSTIDDPLVKSSRFHRGIRHGAEKALSAGKIPGATSEATVQVDWKQDQLQPYEKGDASFMYRRNGQFQIQHKGSSTPVERGNLITDLLDDLNRPTTELTNLHNTAAVLDAINIIDQYGALLFRFVNQAKPGGSATRRIPVWILEYPRN